MTDVGFVEHRFVTTPLEAIDPMGEAVWRALQPQGNDARSIRSAIDRVDDAKIKAEGRVERLTEERQRALLRGTEMSLSTVDVRLARAGRWLERVAALAAALPAELAAAEAREAEAAHAMSQRQAAARVKIARFAKWSREEYGKLARAIAAGLELEQDALSAARGCDLLREMPMAHTGDGNPRSHPPTTFSKMVRLPNSQPGPAIAWPAGEPHPAAAEFSSPYAPAVRQ